MRIKDWPDTERPREKLLLSGAHSLSDAELLAIFIQNGVKGKTAVDIGRELLNHQGSLQRCLSAPVDKLSQQPGIGPICYIRLQAALELGKRFIRGDQSSHKPCLSDYYASRHYFLTQLSGHQHEVFACAFLDTQNRVLAYEELFHGSLTQAAVYPREIAKRAFSHNAAKVVFGHNHPSGSCEPSEADQALTHYLKGVLLELELQVSDHIIVSNGQTVSFAQQDWL